MICDKVHGSFSPWITVAICTHNRRDQLALTLAALQALEAPVCDWEVLVIDNASSDGTASFLAGYDWRSRAPLRFLREERLGVAFARNRAVQEGRGEYVLFLDDDETPDAKWLVAFAQALFDGEPDAAGGRIEVLFFGAEKPQWLTDELLGFLGKLDHGPLPIRLTCESQKIFTGNAAFRRSAVLALGLFDTTLGRRGRVNSGGEDVDLFVRLLRAGRNVLWVPNAVIYHRIEAPKLRRRYFLELHYRQGRMQGHRARGSAARIPPLYLLPQLSRSIVAAVAQRWRQGYHSALRKDMNVAYFAGFIAGWAAGDDSAA
ncbi:MAG: glycosyltransferase [Burkholderiales bacterium]